MGTDGDLCSTSSTGESLKHLAIGHCDEKSYRIGVQQDHRGTLDSIWYKATEICQSNRLKTFLKKQGKLASVCINQGTYCTLCTLFHVQRLNLRPSKFLASSYNLYLLLIMVNVFYVCLFMSKEMLITHLPNTTIR